MSSKNQGRYQHTRGLLILLALLGAVLVAFSLSILWRIAGQQAENQFYRDKSALLDSIDAPYDKLVFQDLPSLSLFQGFLDSAGMAPVATRWLQQYPFIKDIRFYDIQVSNRPLLNGIRAENLSVNIQGAYRFSRNLDPDSIALFNQSRDRHMDIQKTDDFNKAMIKFIGFVSQMSSGTQLEQDVVYKNFYTIEDKRITYLNVPREEDLKTFKSLMYDDLAPSPQYEQDLISLSLDLTLLRDSLTNATFEYIFIRPIPFDTLEGDREWLKAGLPLPGAFSGYQVFVLSSREYLNHLALKTFWPLALTSLIIYLVLLAIGWLIYRNLHVNRQLFRLQNDFISNLSHEVRTPLSVIKITGDNLNAKKLPSEPDIRQFGRIINSEADRLNDLVNRLLALTQLENRSLPVVKESVQLENMLDKLKQEMELRYPDFVIELQLPAHPVTLHTDPVLLNSVFANLAENAYKYSHPGKRVLHISTRKNRNRIHVKFTDQGIGIPKEFREKVFEKFFRVQNEFNQHGSAGIGLALCKELIGYLGGEIELRSTGPRGSTFELLVPSY